MHELLAWMRAHSVTQSELAKSLGLTQGAVSQWVTHGAVPLRRVGEIARLTGLTPQSLRPDVFDVQRP